MIEPVRFYGVLLLCGALGACYNPSYGDCQVSCASGACPAGLECQSGVCRAPGMTGPCTTIDAGHDAGGLGIEDLGPASVEALCRYAVRCGQFEDLPSCLKLYNNIVVLQSDTIAAVSAGSVIFHGDKAEQCLSSRDTLGCERWQSSSRTIDPSCSEVFEGTRHDGEACAINEQCISQRCMLMNCNMACCPGTCAGDESPGPRNIGDACSSLDRCQNGYCDQTTGVCAPYKAATEPCTYSDQCPEGSGCVSTAAMPNPVCRTLVPTNGPCTQSAECLLQGDVCKNGACMPGGLVGSTCATQGECQSFHACSNNQCAQAPGIGQSCLGVGVCTEGYCSFSGDPTMPMCAPKVPDLGTCMVDQGLVQCESRYCNAGKCDQKPVCN